MARPSYPAARRLDIVEDLHNHRVADPYRWLEDPKSAETAEWLDAQDALLADKLAGIPGRDRLRDRLSELLSSGLVTAPAWRGSHGFFMRRAAEQEHAVLLAVEGAAAGTGGPAAGAERVLLDPTALDPSGVTTLDAWQPDK
jgi:prolyl oligopeptidase